MKKKTPRKKSAETKTTNIDAHPERNGRSGIFLSALAASAISATARLMRSLQQQTTIAQIMPKTTVSPAITAKATTLTTIASIRTARATRKMNETAAIMQPQTHLSAQQHIKEKYIKQPPVAKAKAIMR